MKKTLFSLFFVLGALGLLQAQTYHYVGNYQNFTKVVHSNTAGNTHK